MNCSQILPGAVSPGSSSLAIGYFSGEPFVVYASGRDVILLDGHLQHLQTIFGSTCGYGETRVSAVHCAEAVGRLAAAWGRELVIFEPSLSEELNSSDSSGVTTTLKKEFLVEWSAVQTLSLAGPVTSMCWNRDGTQLLTGGEELIYWKYSPSNSEATATEIGKGGADGGGAAGSRQEGEEEGEGQEESDGEKKVVVLKRTWSCAMSSPLHHLKFSPNGELFATCGEESDCLVKIWYPCSTGEIGIGNPPAFNFCYVTHPRAVRGFVWRRVTPSLPRGCIPNVLLTHCTDNICRLWSHSILFGKKGRLRFFIAASIDPVADIPFRTTMPLNHQPFIVHWLNNKERTLTSKVDKYQKGMSLPVSHLSSLQSFASNLNEEILQSWVCIDEGEEDPTLIGAGLGKGGGGGGVATKSEQEMVSFVSRKTSNYSVSNYLSPHSGGGGGGGGGGSPSSNTERPGSASGPSPVGTLRSKISVHRKRALAHLLDEWCSTPDLLMCIHPTVGSLMVWTIEGLDAPPNLERLVHVSFSSCLPHILPPHLSQSLRMDLLQFLIREPDALHTREATAGGGAGDEGEGGGKGTAVGGSTAEMSLPVPQIRLSSGGNMSTMLAEDVRKIKSDSTLILVSSHTNGSLNTWSVELTLQSNYCTSIAGLIHGAGTGGHRSQVQKIHRHPWLPILMTVSTGGNLQISSSPPEDEGEGEKAELIIWNADLPGPLKHKSKLNELSRIIAPDMRSFNHVTWVPPISVGGVNEGALARCPSLGMFVANIGKELILFQASLYSITKPQPSSFMHDKGEETSKMDEEGAVNTSNHQMHGIKVTSQLGMKGISIISVIEEDLDKFDTILGLHTFRMCSLVTTLDLKKSFDERLGKVVILVLVENKKSQDVQRGSSPLSPGSKGTKTFIHLWKLTVCGQSVVPPTSPNTESMPKFDHAQSMIYTASVEKVFSKPLPLPPGTHATTSRPACDISSSLQLQTPTLSAPFLFSTSCSDGVIRCWQFSLKLSRVSPPPPPPPPSEGVTVGSGSESADCACDTATTENMEFDLYEVFNSDSLISDLKFKPSQLDCYEEEVIKSFPTQHYVPSGLQVAYPGRLAMSHSLSKQIKSSFHRNSVTFERPSRTSVVKGNNPLERYSMVSVWECESTGGLKWSCEATLVLVGLPQISAALESAREEMPVLMEWIPMENGAYLLATCFASVISIFGMSLPQDEEHFTVQTRRVGFLPREKASVLSKVKSQASWVCLLQFPCFRPSMDLSISCLAYTGSNSIVVSIGSELHLYSCWVQGENLVAFTPSEQERDKLGRDPFSRAFIQDGVPSQSNLVDTGVVVNLLDYAHARNTPLPQYHPKILMELMNSGKMHAVKSILVNLVKYLVLYKTKTKSLEAEEGTRNYFDSGGMDRFYNDEGEDKKEKMVLSSDGYLRWKKSEKPKNLIESIPHLPIAKMGIVQSEGILEKLSEKVAVPSSEGQKDDYDDLFSAGNLQDMGDMKFGFDDDEMVEEIVNFMELNPEKGEFTSKLSKTLSSILETSQLTNLSDVEQIQLVSIAETVSSAKMTFTDLPSSDAPPTANSFIGLSLSTLSGAGYASSGGSKGREAIDECGLRYLMALERYIALSKCLPEDISPGVLLPSSLVWAFHSDAEVELLSSIPCVQEDTLNWEALKNAGVGWWLRNLDTLRRLMEKLAKAQFTRRQLPLDASLLYLAMKKQSLLKGLFRSVSDTRMTTFFTNDFTNHRWNKAALKNAFALLGKQRFEEAAAFFLLADKLWDAVEVCVSRLHDMQLAFIIIRLYEGDHGPIYERFLKEFLLGVPSTQSIKSNEKNLRLEASPDPFLRSMACWCLQDYSGALDTLLQDPEVLRKEGGGGGGGGEGAKEDEELQVFLTNPAIFNFYFYLRSNPFLVRRHNNHVAKTSFLMGGESHSAGGLPSQATSSLSSVGDQPLTAIERSLLFSTAYYHLCHGCPLLVLNVLSKLPKSGKLGTDVSQGAKGVNVGDGGGRGNGQDSSKMAGMIESGTLASSFNKKKVVESDDDFDWGAPVSRQEHIYGGALEEVNEEDEEEDWSKPVSSGNRLDDDDDDDIDWSKPISSSRLFDSTTLSPPNLENSPIHQSPPSSEKEPTEAPPNTTQAMPSSMLTTRGLFVLALAEQLQYNACLSILTEELHSIYLPACCHYLWELKGQKGLPILPLPKQSLDSELSLVQHYNRNAFDRTVQNLRGMLTNWLREEMEAVKEVCRLESSRQQHQQVKEEGGSSPAVVSSPSEEYVTATHRAPSGYDLLTTLMNYAALHAATSPSLLTVKFELMHLVNTLLPWSPGFSGSADQHSQSIRPDTSMEVVPTFAVDPSQLPIFTSCSLPVRHLTNLATHLRLLSCCITKVLAGHSYPPILSQPLPQVGKIFELCSAISHCLTVSLNPLLFSSLSEDTPIPRAGGMTGSTDSPGSTGGRTPTPSSALAGDIHHHHHHQQHQQQERKANYSPLLRQRFDSFSNLDSTIGSPNTKPSKWPGVTSWPRSLTSDEGRDPTLLSVVLVECVVCVYIGLVATAWSRHSIEDLLILLKNAPSMNGWYSMMGGGVDGRKSERILSRSFVSQTIESVSKKFRRPRRNNLSSSQHNEEEEVSPGVFIAPKRTLLDHFLSLPVEEEEGEGEGSRRRISAGGYLLVGGKEEREVSIENEEGDEDDDFEELYDSEGISFKVGGGGEVGEADNNETSPRNPNCFVWCLMNLCISRILQQTVKKMVAGVGLEVVELVTVSPTLYSTLKILDEWESIFTRRLEVLGEAPDDLFDNDGAESPQFRIGISLMRHKFILEPDNSPFRSKDSLSVNAKKLWQYLVHQDEPRETFIQYIFMNKSTQTTAPVNNFPDEDSDIPSEPCCKVIHKEPDSTISAFCLNSCNRMQTTVLALALSREIIEIEVPDTSLLDTMTPGSGENLSTSPKRSMSIATPLRQGEGFVMVQSTSHINRHKSTTFTSQIRRSIPNLTGTFSSSQPQLTHGQTGNSGSLLMRRSSVGVKRMAPHPSLAYYLTGSLDGSVIMWEFGTPNLVATQRSPGMGGGVTKIRFTPEGNKFGVTDNNGKLSLWQGIHTSAKSAYHILHTAMKCLNDFLFLGSSSFIATCGDGVESKNLFLWDTLMPPNRSIVKEFACHDGGATSLGYSLMRQRLFCGGKKGEVCVFDIRQSSLLHSIPAHTSSINCIAVNDVDGYFVTGASDGDIKIIDSSTLIELAYFPGQHAKARLFRHGEGGVTDLDIMPGGKLYSCGADGTIKCQTLKL